SLVAAGGGPPDIAVDCTGDRAVWELLPEVVRPGGQVLLFGGCAPGETVTFDAARLHYAEVSLVGSFHYTPTEARAALDALAARAASSRLAGRSRICRDSSQRSRREKGSDTPSWEVSVRAV